MFAYKPWTEFTSRILLSTAILCSAFVPAGVSARSLGKSEDINISHNANNNLASGITLGIGDPATQEEVPILAEQIAQQAQEQQEEKQVKFKVWAEPAIYTPGNPISLHWKVENLKQDAMSDAVIVVHAPAELSPTDPNPTYTLDGLVSIPLSSKKDFSEWSVGASAANTGLSNYGFGYKDVINTLIDKGLRPYTYYPGGNQGIYYFTDGSNGNNYAIWLSVNGEQTWLP